jgi:MFS family permease
VHIRRTGLWRHEDFLKLWAGESISVFGTLIGGLALSFAAIIWLDATAFEVAVLALCQIVPGFVVGPLAGVWVDRLHRRPIMMVADLGRFPALATILAACSMPEHRAALGVAILASALTPFDVAYWSYLQPSSPAGTGGRQREPRWRLVAVGAHLGLARAAHHGVGRCS